jgi:hypothetical protein
VAKHLIDTDLYIDLIQSGTTLPFIRELYEKEAPGIYFSSVVAQEVLAGAWSRTGQKARGNPIPTIRESWTDRGSWTQPLERCRGHFSRHSTRQTRAQKQTADIGERLFAGVLRPLPGAILYTRNRDDFALLQRRRSFSLVVLSS